MIKGKLKEIELICWTMGDPKSLFQKEIFLCIHPDEYDKYYSILSNNIGRNASTANIYSVRNSGEKFSSDAVNSFLDCLSQMQVVIVAVTNKFFEPGNFAKDVVLKNALEKEIPVIPIKLDDGVGYKFSYISDGMQAIQGNLSTQQGLQKTVEDIFITLNKLFMPFILPKPEDFDVQFFISYRTLDTKYVETMMEGLRQYDDFEAVLFWYDKYLRIGENYRKNISDMLSSSEAMLLIVTKNTFIKNKNGEENFVVRCEIPMARSEKHSKLIIPLLMDDDVSEEELGSIGLSKKDCIDGTDIKAIRACLVKLLESRGISLLVERSAVQYKNLGTRYINGSDVEHNEKLGIRLLEKAEKRGNKDAIEELVLYLRYHGKIEAAIDKQISYCDRLFEEVSNNDVDFMYLHPEVKILCELLHIRGSEEDLLVAAEYISRAILLLRELCKDPINNELWLRYPSLITLFASCYKRATREEAISIVSLCKEALPIAVNRMKKFWNSSPPQNPRDCWPVVNELYIQLLKNLETMKDYEEAIKQIENYTGLMQEMVGLFPYLGDDLLHDLIDNNLIMVKYCNIVGRRKRASDWLRIIDRQIGILEEQEGESQFVVESMLKSLFHHINVDLLFEDNNAAQKHAEMMIDYYESFRNSFQLDYEVQQYVRIVSEYFGI
ncbi:MAG: toll/interleukin-1 receptor domain-containing protein [Lachnospiraceae bacterium]|nr:toll/interleukin-1 receptor domain-containing protein [Lachnospiraceae bacterium]